MKIYLNKNVYDSAIERINFIFDEFKNVIVSFSGGKDSTVILNLALEVARKKKRLPLKVLFLDQEAEWQSVIDYTKRVMYSEEIEPLWYQVPIKLFNATSMDNPWLMCWEEGGDWMRDKDPIAIKENTYGTDRFHASFPKILEERYPNESAVYLVGMRCEESTARVAALTNQLTYKDVTWGRRYTEKKKFDKQGFAHYSFSPLYDWTTSDVWKAIHNNNWEYCTHYDTLYQHGISPMKMRVSNLHHETAVHALFFLHEVEPNTWVKLTSRLKGINQTKHLSQDEMFRVKTLPYMFKDWKEYRDYLTEKLITIPEHQDKFKKRFLKDDVKYRSMKNIKDLYKKQIISILCNDHEFVRLENFTQHNTNMVAFRKTMAGKSHASHAQWNRYIWSKDDV